MMKVFKKEMYGLDVCRIDVEDFVNVLNDFGYKVEDLGGNDVTTLVIEGPKSGLERLVEMYEWKGGVVGPYTRS